MRFVRGKKGLALLVTVAVVGAAAFGAYAYFTTTGSGTGSSKVATPTGWVVTQSASGSCATATGYCDTGTLWPAIADPLSTVYATNNNPGPLELQTVTVKIASITLGGGTDGTGPTQCDESYFGFAHGDALWNFTGPSPADPGGGVGGGGVGTTATYTYPSPVSVASGSYQTLPALSVILQDSSANQNVCQGATVVLTTTVS